MYNIIALLTTAIILIYLYYNFSLVSFIIDLFGSIIMLSTLIWPISIYVSDYIKTFTTKLRTNDKIILITGCDRGFGYETALKLNEKGFKVFAGCLDANSDEAKSLVEKAKYTDLMVPIQMDVTNQKQIDDVYKAIVEMINENPQMKLWSIINNAGILLTFELELGTLEDTYKKLFNVNTFAVVNVTRKFLPLLRKSRGRIIVVNSIAGRYSATPLGAYCMTKHASVAFCDALRMEMERFSVKVISIEPFYFNTNLIDVDKLKQIECSIWNDTSEEIRHSYYHTKSDIKEKYEYFLKKSSFGPNKKISEVPNTIIKCIMDPDPYHKYMCATLFFKVSLHVLSILPREISDPLLKIINKWIKFTF